MTSRPVGRSVLVRRVCEVAQGPTSSGPDCTSCSRSCTQSTPAGGRPRRSYCEYGMVDASSGSRLDHWGVPSADNQIVIVSVPADLSEAAAHDSVRVNRQSHIATDSIAVLQVTDSGLLS